MTLVNKIAYYFDYMRPTWNKKRLVRTALDNKPYDTDLSKRFWKQQHRFDNKKSKKLEKKHKKIQELLKKGKKKKAIELLLSKNF